MQAGLTRRRLTLRKIFSSRVVFRASNNGLLELFDSVPSVKVAAWRMAPAASQHLMTEHRDGDGRHGGMEHWSRCYPDLLVLCGARRPIRRTIWDSKGPPPTLFTLRRRWFDEGSPSALLSREVMELS
jgi:hypothetical protein